MGIFDWLFGKKGRDSANETDLIGTSKSTSKKNVNSGQIKKPNSINQFTKKEQSDLRVYAFNRCLGEMMKADGTIDPSEVEFFSKFSNEEMKKMSEPYDVGSKLGKFIWGNNYKSVSTNRANLISVIKTYSKKDLDNFFKKIIVMAVADRNLDNRESEYLIELCADVYNVSKKDGKDIAGTYLKKLGLIK